MSEINLLNQIYANQKINGQFTDQQKNNVQKINEIVNKFIRGEISDAQKAAQQIIKILGDGGTYLPLISNRNWESFNLDIQCKSGAKLTIKIENGSLSDSFEIKPHLSEQNNLVNNNLSKTRLLNSEEPKEKPITKSKHLHNIFDKPELATKCTLSVRDNKIILKIPQGSTKEQDYVELYLSGSQAEKLINNYYFKIQTTSLTKGELKFVANLLQLTTQLNINQKFNFNKTEFTKNLQPLQNALKLINFNKTDFKQIQIVFNLLQDFITDPKQSRQAISIQEFFNDFQKQYADLLPDSSKKLINDFLNGKNQSNNQQVVFNNLLNQIFVSQQNSGSQKDSFIKLCLSESLMDSMGYFTGTVIVSDIQALAQIIQSATEQYLSIPETQAQKAINTILNSAIKSSIEQTEKHPVSQEKIPQNYQQLAMIYSSAIKNNNPDLLKDYLTAKELIEFTAALKIIPPSVRNELANDINKISYQITYDYLVNKIGNQNKPLETIVSKTVNNYDHKIRKYSFDITESLVKNNGERTSLAVLDRLYDPKNKLFQWAAVNRAQNTKTTAIITTSIVLTIATVGTAGALAPAQSSLLATMLSGKTILTSIGGGTLLTFSQEVVNSIYGDATWQDKEMSTQQKFNRTFATVLINSLSMYGAIAGGAYAKGLDISAKQGIISTFRAATKALGFDVAESVVNSTAQSIIDLTEKILSGKDFNLTEVVKDFDSELKMNLLMAVVGNLVGLGLENATKAAKRLYQEALQLRFTQLTNKVTIRTDNGKMPDQLTKQFGEKNARKIFDLTSQAKIKQQEFLSIDYTVGNKLETLTIWGNQYNVDFDASKLPKDAKIAAVFHGGPHATGMSLEDQKFYKLLSKDTLINHIDTEGAGSVIQFASRSHEQKLPSLSHLNSSSEIAVFTRTLEKATTREQLNDWLKNLEVIKDQSGRTEVREAKKRIREIYYNFLEDFKKSKNAQQHTINFLQKTGHGSETRKVISTNKITDQQALIKKCQTEIAFINSQYRRKHINHLFEVKTKERLTFSQDSFKNRVEELNQALVDEFYALKNTTDRLKTKNTTISTNRLQSSVNFLDGLIENIDKNLEWLEKNPRIGDLDTRKKLMNTRKQAYRIKSKINDEIFEREIKYNSRIKIIHNKK